jgi:hypothetical protein
MTETVLEKLGTTESTTLALKRQDGGKIRVTSTLWESPSPQCRRPAPCRGSPGTTTTRTSGRVLMTLALQPTK